MGILKAVGRSDSWPGWLSGESASPYTCALVAFGFSMSPTYMPEHSVYPVKKNVEHWAGSPMCPVPWDWGYNKIHFTLLLHSQTMMM